MKIGWFLHTPFPASEIYVTLPMRKEILRGVLAANLIGFQIYDYVRHFMTACARVLGDVHLLLCPVVVVPAVSVSTVTRGRRSRCKTPSASHSPAARRRQTTSSCKAKRSRARNGQGCGLSANTMPVAWSP